MNTMSDHHETRPDLHGAAAAAIPLTMRVDEDERLHGHCPDCGQWKRLHGVIGSTTRRCARCRGAAIAHRFLN